jgi:hypothetical protein
MLLLRSITSLLKARRWTGFRTTLYKIRAHTNIRGNDLVDAVAKLAVAYFDTLPPAHTLQVDIGKKIPCPSHWDMYSAKPPITIPALSIGINHVTFRRPWGTIPEADRM